MEKTSVIKREIDYQSRERDKLRKKQRNMTLTAVLLALTIFLIPIAVIIFIMTIMNGKKMSNYDKKIEQLESQIRMEKIKD